jgi:Ca-activated chloride channel family protein
MPENISEFYLQWPWALLLLLLLPVMLFAWLRAERQRWQQALRFSYAAVAEHLARNPMSWKRLFTPLITGLTMLLLILALCRPTVVGRVAVQSVDLMMIMDISLSMMAEDLRPTRMAAAKEAGIRFINSLPKDARIGLEFFAGNTYVASPPVREHQKVADLLASLRLEDLQPFTEIGSALQTGLKTLRAMDEEEPARPLPGNDEAPRETPRKKPPQRVIILLSDGDSTGGYPWDQAAMNAKTQNVRVFTVGIGSPGMATIVYQGEVLPVTFNEGTLRRIAEMTNGRYFRVFSEKDFRAVYEQIRERAITYEEREQDLAWLFSALALGVMSFGLLFGMFRIRTLP